MGVDKAHRELVLAFDGTQITLTRRTDAEAFAEQKKAMGHSVRQLRFYDGSTLCTTIFADFTDHTVAAENHTGDPVKTAFGRNAMPTWVDFEAFLEDRCVPRQRAGLREYLENIGVAEYDPLTIIGKTSGRMAEDAQWLAVEESK